MKTLLICHSGEPVSRQGLSRWLASFSDLVGVIVLDEKKGRLRQRIRREISRVGVLRFVDVLLFRIYYKLFLAAEDRRREQSDLAELQDAFEAIPSSVPILNTHSPNSKAAREFVEKVQPDIMLARCKTLLRERVFSIPSKGTFVMHPGVCPEYRNAHGCFWALAKGDIENVGMTLLKIDAGVDTGPVFGFYSYDFDEVDESHIVIQNRVVVKNLDLLKEKFIAIESGCAEPIDTSGRESSTWGQPWLSAYLKWKRQARKRAIGKKLSGEGS